MKVAVYDLGGGTFDVVLSNQRWWNETVMKGRQL
jgi:molecular chaperone DnaK (HSP70)